MNQQRAMLMIIVFAFIAQYKLRHKSLIDIYMSTITHFKIRNIL